MSIIHFNEVSFHKIIQKDKLVIVKFSAPWCSFCHRSDAAYERLAAKYSQDYIFGEVNIDLFPQLEAEAGIEIIPTFVIYRKGEVMDAIVNPPNGNTLELFISEHCEPTREELEAFLRFQALI